MRVIDDRGQAVVEFALVVPILVSVAFAIVVVSDVAVARLALLHATAEGARAGALTNDDEVIRATIAATVAPLPRDRITTAIEPPETEPPRNADPRGSLLTVRASYDLQLPLAFVGLGQITVNGTAARRIEWTP